MGVAPLADGKQIMFDETLSPLTLGAGNQLVDWLCQTWAHA